jgi:galactokinase
VPSSHSAVANPTRTFRAPGRVNLIGEHTDYNDGFVMPAALDFSTFITLQPRNDSRLRFYSDSFGESVEVDLHSTLPARRGHWSDYPVGVAVTLKRAGYDLRGADLTIKGNVPLGAGLSSSASIEVATACALSANSNLTIERTELARLCQKAENDFVGARVGIMDQFVSLFGQARTALLLDCRSLEFSLLPLSDEVRLVMCNTMVKHELASSGYNERRAQCEEGVRFLATVLPNVTALRDVGPDALHNFAKEIPEVVYRRCRHIVTENARVLAAAEALRQNDLVQFGELMDHSHSSLRDDFEVSCRELDLMVDLSRKVDGVFGSRMTGGGFGGCTVNLVAADAVEGFTDVIAREYEEATRLKPEIYVCNAADGAAEVLS